MKTVREVKENLMKEFEVMLDKSMELEGFEPLLKSLSVKMTVSFDGITASAVHTMKYKS